MKRNHLLAFAASLALLLSSACSKEKLAEPTENRQTCTPEEDCELIDVREPVDFKDSLIFINEGGKRFLKEFTAYAAREKDPDITGTDAGTDNARLPGNTSKTTVDMATGHVSWTDGDVIKLCNGSECADYIYDAASGTFHSDTPLEEKGCWTGYYPASVCGTHSDGKMSATLPSESANTADNAPMMCNHDKESAFIFRNVMSIVKLKVTGENRVTKVTFAANDANIPVTGSGWFDDASSALYIDNGPNEISFTPANAIQLSENETVFCFQVPATTYTGGFTISVTFSDGTVKRKVRASTLSASGNTIFAMKAFRAGFFSGGKGTWNDQYLIATAADLVEMSELCNNDGTAYDKFRSARYVQTANIDLSGVNDFIPICQNRAKPFTGWFYGSYNENFYKIYNLRIGQAQSNMPTGLFGCLGSNGRLYDIHISALGGISEIVGNKSTGALVGEIDGASIQNCRIVNTYIKGSQQVGGILGLMKGDSWISGCVVDGSVTVDATELDAGGIAGRLDGDNTRLRNSTVRAALVKVTKSASFSYSRVGGLVGSLIDGYVTNSVSHARLEAAKPQIGGIAGCIYGRAGGTNNCRIVNCVYGARIASDGSSEGGTITTTSDSGVRAGGIVGSCSSESGRSAGMRIAGCYAYPQLVACNGESCSEIGGIIGTCSNADMMLYNCASPFFYTLIQVKGQAISDISKYGSIGCIAGTIYALDANSAFFIGRSSFRMAGTGSSVSWSKWAQVSASCMKVEDVSNSITLLPGSGGGEEMTYTDIAAAMKAGAESYNGSYAGSTDKVLTGWVKSTAEGNCFSPSGYYVPAGLLEAKGSEEKDKEKDKPSNVTLELGWLATSPSVVAGSRPDSFQNTVITVKGKDYVPTKDAITGNWCITVPYSENVGATLKFVSPGRTLSEVPMSQIYATAQKCLQDNPRRASCNTENSRKLEFTDYVSGVELRLTGNAKIASIKVEDPDGALLCGEGGSLEGDVMTFATGLPFAVLNTTQGGAYVQLSSEITSFFIPIAPRNYAHGLKFSICDSNHLRMSFTTGAVTFRPGQTGWVKREYAADKNLVWYEGFDNCVWGGDCSYAPDGIAYAPDNTDPGTTGGLERSGYETDLVHTSNTYAGNGFINIEAGESTPCQVTDSYMASRNFTTGCVRLYRCQEMQGAITIGKGDDYRGSFETAKIKNIDGIINMDVSIRFKLDAHYDNNLIVYSNRCGSPGYVRLDGQEIDKSRIECRLKYTTGRLVIPNSLLPVSGKDVDKEWHTLTVRYYRVTDGMSLYISNEKAGKGKHGVILDEIKMTKVSDIPEHNLRVLYWNIQYGMWADQGDNYANFIKWVKKYDPDVCVWCEGQTYFKTGTDEQIPVGSGYLPGGWAELAAYYGHSYVARSGQMGAFPQIVTSKYPITTVFGMTRMTDGRVLTRGAGYHSVTVNGCKINLVTLHLWPFNYSPTVDPSERPASEAAHEGSSYRTDEIHYIMDRTLLDAEYSSEQYWIVCGDSNAYNILDYPYLKEGGYVESETDFHFWPHIWLQQNTDLCDAIRKMYKTDYTSAGIDAFYVSPELYDKQKSAMCLLDSWSFPQPCSVPGFDSVPSDHSPIMVDFML